MRDKLSDKVRLQHAMDAIAEVEQYLDNVPYQEFLENSEKRFATSSKLRSSAKPATLTSELKEQHPEVPWKPIIRLRNISIHEYFGVNLQLVWEIAKNDLPDLKDKLAMILESMTE
jgi:uncharacterized protein with HEPN domain